MWCKRPYCERVDGASADPDALQPGNAPAFWRALESDQGSAGTKTATPVGDVYDGDVAIVIEHGMGDLDVAGRIGKPTVEVRPPFQPERPGDILLADHGSARNAGQVERSLCRIRLYQRVEQSAWRERIHVGRQVVQVRVAFRVRA